MTVLVDIAFVVLSLILGLALAWIVAWAWFNLMLWMAGVRK
jgi:hypothetical protein